MTPQEDTAYWAGFRQGFTVALVGASAIALALGVLVWAVWL